MRRRRACGRPTIALAGLAVLAVLATSAPAPAAGELVAFAVDGVLFAVRDVHGVLDDSIALGGPMRASVVYDSATVDRMPSDPSWGYYLQPIPPASLQIEVGNYLFEASVLEISTIDNGIFGLDSLFFGKEPRGDFQDFPRVPGAVVASLSVYLDDATETALSSDDLPTEPPTSPPWSQGQVSVEGCLATEAGPVFCEYPPSIALRASIARVPEAGAWGRLGAALVGLGLARQTARPRRRRVPPTRSSRVPSRERDRRASAVVSAAAPSQQGGDRERRTGEA